jgi:hypothetical protein
LDWFGTDATDKAIFSLIILIPLVLACACAVEANKNENRDWTNVIKNTFVALLVVFVFIVVFNGLGMGMDTTYQTEANDSNLGIFYGFRLLSNVTDADINNIATWGIGLRTIIQALFLIVPFIICIWGGLSVLTADSLDEAEGGIMAIIAAIIVVIIVWMFQLVDIFVG